MWVSGALGSPYLPLTIVGLSRGICVINCKSLQVQGVSYNIVRFAVPTAYRAPSRTAAKAPNPQLC